MDKKLFYGAVWQKNVRLFGQKRICLKGCLDRSKAEINKLGPSLIRSERSQSSELRSGLQRKMKESPNDLTVDDAIAKHITRLFI
ncbi:hypothetical protein Tco_0037236 [Tanacetum coccineum]